MPPSRLAIEAAVAAAFSRTGGNVSGEFEDAVLIGSFGDQRHPTSSFRQSGSSPASFRATHGARLDPGNGPFPFFVGVFETLAALQSAAGRHSGVLSHERDRSRRFVASLLQAQDEQIVGASMAAMDGRLGTKSAKRRSRFCDADPDGRRG